MDDHIERAPRDHLRQKFIDEGVIKPADGALAFLAAFERHLDRQGYPYLPIGPILLKNQRLQESWRYE